MTANIIDITTYPALAARTEKQLPARYDRMVHAILGLITEVGEFTTEIKRHVIYEKPFDDEMRTNLIEELGDIQWYLAVGFATMGLDFSPMINGMKVSTDLPRSLSLDGVSASYAIQTASLIENIAGVDMTLKTSRERIMLNQTLATMVSLSMEVADVYLHTDYNRVLAANIVKLQKRYPEKYSDAAAEARADKNGLDARSS